MAGLFHNPGATKITCNFYQSQKCSARNKIIASPAHIVKVKEQYFEMEKRQLWGLARALTEQLIKL